MLKKEKHDKSSHMNQDILKWYYKVKTGQNDKKGQNEDRKMKRWWNDDVQLNIDS